MKKTFLLVTVLALVLGSCGVDDSQIATLKAENEKLKKELAAGHSKFMTRKNVKFVQGTTPVLWSDYKDWIKSFQEAYYYENSEVYYSSFLLDKNGLNKFLSSPDVKYLHVLWGMDPDGSNTETMIVRGIGASGTIYYLNESGNPDEQGSYVLQHCLPCPPCADTDFEIPPSEYDFRQ